MRASIVNSQEILDAYRAGEEVRDVGCFMPIVSNIDPDLAPPGKQLICAAFGGIHGVEVDKKLFKDLILDYVQEVVGTKTNVREHIEWFDAITPDDLNIKFGEKGKSVYILVIFLAPLSPIFGIIGILNPTPIVSLTVSIVFLILFILTFGWVLLHSYMLNFIRKRKNGTEND